MSTDVPDRGAIAVEAAILVPFLVLLVFGAIEVAQLMRTHIAVTSLTREAARTASAVPRLDGFTLDAANAAARSAETLDLSRIEMWVYRATSADGRPTGACPSDTCERFLWNNATPGAFVRVTAASTPLERTLAGPSWSPTSINACITDPDGSDRRDWVGVRVVTRHDWLTGAVFRGASIAVTAQAVMKFEPVVVPPRPGETNTNLLVCRAP